MSSTWAGMSFGPAEDVDQVDAAGHVGDAAVDGRPRISVTSG
jgi:hypothetical protein